MFILKIVAGGISTIGLLTVKPDLDNYIKSTLDALNGIIWADDARIVDLHAHKYYSDRPRIEITVRKL